MRLNKKNIINSIVDSKIASQFLSAPSPKWLVFITDLVIVAFSCLVTFIFNPDHDIYAHNWYGTPLWQSIIIFTTYFLSMLLIRSHCYIVRLSVVNDLYRITVLVVTSSVALTALDGLCYVVTGHLLFNLWNIFVIGLLSFTIMMLVRLAIKYIYRALTSPDAKRKRVIALGSAGNTLSFATALNDEPEGRYKVVAMISLTPSYNSKSFNNIPIFLYDSNTIQQIFEEYRAEAVIFPATLLKYMRSGVADQFLSHNIALLMYSGIEEFDQSANTNNASGNVRNIHIEDLLGRDVIQPDTSNVEQQLRGQIVMITGAAGSIGSEIVNQVASMQASEIVLVDQAETPMHELQLFMEANHPDIKIHLFVGDITNKERMERAFSLYRPRYVFHAAAYKHVPMMERNPSEAILTNVFGTKNIADLSVKYDVEKFVMISTDKAVNPTNVMGASKRIAEIYVQSLFFHASQRSDRPTTRFITTRFGNVLGSNGSVIPLFRKQIEQGGPVTVTHRDIIRYFMTIPEACSLVLQAGTMGRGGEIYIFDMGQPVKIYDLATRMISLSGLRPGVDIDIIETGLRPGEKLYEELLNDRELTMATSHNKIMIAKVRTYDYNDVAAHIEALSRYTHAGDYHDIVAEMKRIVPEFKSKNSRWESIDKEISQSEIITEIQQPVQ